ncbi:hypothetical protein [Streptacidiphilus monticola]|uniref:Uncharacterized protein n=1 Tax=Streptacidiphilus monticola TaxID=2161674 RepID=A0ABW1FXM5_9ACTN
MPVAVAPRRFLSGGSSAPSSFLAGGERLPRLRGRPVRERRVGGAPTRVRKVETPTGSR